jgi:hypothetical protein
MPSGKWWNSILHVEKRLWGMCRSSVNLLVGKICCLCHSGFHIGTYAGTFYWQWCILNRMPIALKMNWKPIHRALSPLEHEIYVFQQRLQIQIITSRKLRMVSVFVYMQRIQNSDWLRAGRPRGRSSSPCSGKIFLFSTSSSPPSVLRPTQPPIQWVLRDFPWGTAAGAWSLSAHLLLVWMYKCTSTPPDALMAWCIFFAFSLWTTWLAICFTLCKLHKYGVR